MDNFLKIALIIIVPIGVFFALKILQENQEEKERKKREEEDTPSCEELSNQLYWVKKQEARDALRLQHLTEEMTHQELQDFVYKYRDEAINSGVQNTYKDLYDYALWAEAQQTMIADGYCENTTV